MPKKKKMKKAKKQVSKNTAKKPKKAKENASDKYFITYVPEIKMLEKGKVPTETKMGSEFKGKNKIIISGK